METTAVNALTISLEALPRELLSYCFSMLSSDYFYGDLWRIGLVSKVCLEQINDVKNRFPQKMRVDPSEFEASVLQILRTTIAVDDIKCKLKAHMRRYKFPALTKQYQKECNQCRAPVTCLLQLENTYEEKGDRFEMRWRQEAMNWCSEKHSLVLTTYTRIKGYYMWEYYDDSYKRHKVLTVDEAINEIIQRRTTILQIHPEGKS